MNSKELELGATFTNDFSTQCGVLVDEGGVLAAMATAASKPELKCGGYVVLTKIGEEGTCNLLDATSVAFGRIVEVTIANAATAGKTTFVSVDGKKYTNGDKTAAADVAAKIAADMAADGINASASTGVITIDFGFGGDGVSVEVGTNDATQTISISDDDASDVAGYKPMGVVRRNTMGIEKADGDGVEVVTRGKIAVLCSETGICGKDAFFAANTITAKGGFKIGKFVTNANGEGIAVVEINL